MFGLTQQCKLRRLHFTHRCGARRGNVPLLLIYLIVQHAKHSAVLFLKAFKEKCYLLCCVTLNQTNYSFVAT